MHRGEGDSDGDSSEEDSPEAQESGPTLRETREIQPTKRITQFYSTETAEKLFNAVGAYVEAMEIDKPKYSKHMYRAYLKMLIEDEEEPDAEPETIDFTVEVSKV